MMDNFNINHRPNRFKPVTGEGEGSKKPPSKSDEGTPDTGSSPVYESVDPNNIYAALNVQGSDVVNRLAEERIGKFLGTLPTPEKVDALRAVIRSDFEHLDDIQVSGIITDHLLGVPVIRPA